MITRRDFFKALAGLPLVFEGKQTTNDIYQTGQAAYPIHPGDLLIRREDGRLYPFRHAHPFAGVAISEAEAGECVEYVGVNEQNR